MSLRDVERAMIVFKYFYENMENFSDLIDKKQQEEERKEANDDLYGSGDEEEREEEKDIEVEMVYLLLLELVNY